MPSRFFSKNPGGRKTNYSIYRMENRCTYARVMCMCAGAASPKRAARSDCVYPVLMGGKKRAKKIAAGIPDLQKPAGKLMPASSAESWCTYTRLRREVGAVRHQIVNEPIEVMRISAAVHLRAFSTVQALRNHQRRKLRLHGAYSLLDGFPDGAGFW